MQLGAAFLHLCFLTIFLSFVLVASVITLRELWRVYARDRLELGKYVLILQNGSGREVAPLRLRTTTIGRGAENHVVLEHATVSRRHAEIRRKTGFYKLCDLDSTNGTRLNGKPVSGAGEVLRVGDVMSFGDNNIGLRLDTAQSADAGAYRTQCASAAGTRTRTIGRRALPKEDEIDEQ